MCNTNETMQLQGVYNKKQTQLCGYRLLTLNYKDNLEASVGQR